MADEPSDEKNTDKLDMRSCLHALENLVTEQPGNGQREVLERVTDLFFATADQQEAADTELFGDAMEQLAYALESEVRGQLSKQMALVEKAPHKLVRRLADDEIDVAKPVLEGSSCLTDEDLIGIAKSKGQEHLKAISGRDTLSYSVTDVIVERGDDDVLADIASNKGAELSRSSLEHMSDRATSNAPLLSALQVRSDLPSDIVDRVKQTVAKRLKDDLAESNPELDTDKIDELIELNAATVETAPPSERDLAFERLRARKNISEEMLAGFARSRLVPETIHCLSVLAELDRRIASHCLLKADLAALAILSKSCSFQNATFAALIQIRTSEVPLTGKEIADAMRHYDTLKQANADEMISAVKERFTSQSAARTSVSAA